ncbi:MAG: amino acid ABC transporter permease [Clostridia bacterium]|nr:amino acid ABC transporter permease [Clostridia bacterium]
MSTLASQFPIVVRSLNLGFLQSLRLFFVTLIGALPLGLLISFGSMSAWAPLAKLGLRKRAATGKKTRFTKFCAEFRPISLIVRVIVWIFRGTPLMLQLLIIFYFPGLVWGNNVWGSGEAGRFAASCIAFVINYACYFSEIYRGGIEGIPRGQYEAGQVLGMKHSQIFRRVVLLQVVKRIIPPMGNEIITLVKDTSLARIIALQEIIWAGQAFMKGSHGISGAIWPLFFTGVYYLVFTGIVTLILGAVEKKLGYFKA